MRHILERDDLHPKILVSVRAKDSVFQNTLVKDAIGVVNWHMPTSFSPKGYAFSIESNSPLRKMISEAGNFSINFIAKENRQLIKDATQLDFRFADSFATLGLSKTESEKIESPSISESAAVLECELIHELESADHTIITGRVVNTINR